MAKVNSTRFLNRLRFMFDKKLTIANLLTTAADSHGEAPLFLTDRDITFGEFGSEMSLNQFVEAAHCLRQILEERCQLVRYDRVAILKTNSAEIFFLGYSVMRAGKIAVPINGGMASESANRYLNYTGAKALFTDLETYQRLSSEGGIPSCVEVIMLTDTEEVPVQTDPKQKIYSLPLEYKQLEPKALPPIEMASDDICMICHTSGTTGFPKGVIHTNESLVQGIRAQLKTEPITSADVCLSASPFNHFINFTGFMSAMAANIKTWVVVEERPEYLLELIDREKISVVFCFPHTFLHMYEHGLESYDLSTVRMWIAGADSSHEAHIKTFLQKGAFLRIFGKRVINALYVDSFGSSEVGFAALFRFTTERSTQFERYVGKPAFAGPKVKVANEAGKPLPDGQAGRFMVKGPTLFRGYWNDHEKTLGEVIDGWWWTGDVARRDKQGRFFHLDRAADVIKSKQGDVFSQPIEEKLLLVPPIVEAVVVGVGCPGAQDKVALIQLANTDTRDDLSTFKLELNERLEDKEKIDRVMLVSEEDIPRGLTGKVLKRVVRDNLSLQSLG